ncbi:MAG: hypothetical protein JO283_15035 [Bradyrhizobium sp.]|nr:hypothetical protein [Bradyrhizobium sp.]
MNLVWLLLGVLALAATIRARIRLARENAHRRCKTAPAWLHVCGTALIVAALFPYISATDDVLRIQQLDSRHGQTNPVNPRSSDSLMRLYEAMDTPVVSKAPQIALVLFCVALFIAPVRALNSRSVPLPSGRSPPALVS